MPLRLRTERPFQVEAVVTGSTFSAWRKAFVEEHCDKFSFDDENKLEYTQIHEKYEVGGEDILRKEMLKGFATEDFMAALPSTMICPIMSDLNILNGWIDHSGHFGVTH